VVSSAPDIERTASRLHDRLLVWDAHMDTLQGAVADGVDLGLPSQWHDLSQWRRGGVRAQVFAVWVDTIYGPHHAARRALQQVDAFHQLCDRYPDQIELARTAADVRRIVKSGKLAGLLSLEGGLAIQNDLSLLRIFHRLGVSSMTLTHSNSIDWVDSSTDRPRSNGLSEFGREVIHEMNRLGMIVDLSHVSDQAVRDVLAISTVPVIASHSSARALCDHPRNLSDELLRAIADRGGVIGVNFYAAFIDIATWQATLAIRGDSLAELNRPPAVSPEDLDREAAHRIRTFFAYTVPVPPLERLVDHLIHLLAVVGEDHVALGSDLGSLNIPLPVGIASPEDFPKITAELLRRGVSEPVLEKVLGKNWLRVWETVTRS
jgi:membrane dipeptidase